MRDARITAFVALTTIVFVGTIYSVLFQTYLDTSNASNLPHHLSETHYFANKKNWLNVYFIKQAWGWTSAAFFALWLTSPPNARTPKRLFKWLTATVVWLAFTGWFFGPGLFERLTIASGGECMLLFPDGDVVVVPNEHCHASSVLSPATHPDLFSQTLQANSQWSAVPKLRRGHDVSGHIFLITMSILFLSDQLRPSLRWVTTPGPRAQLHQAAVWINMGLIVMWLFACATTTVYFHSPLEKLSGYREQLSYLVKYVLC
jgi:hypothetical protein